MAFSWNEKYATLITAKTWNESVEGYKITNVFGLAWNYYIAYTKFITGLDLTLDMGVKMEFFFADTYKIGYANETVFGTPKSTDLTKLGVRVYETIQNLVTTREDVGVNRAVTAVNEDVNLEGRNAMVNDDTLEGLSSEEIWAIAKSIVSGTFSVEAAQGATVDSGPSYLIVGPGGVAAGGPLVDIG